MRRPGLPAAAGPAPRSARARRVTGIAGPAVAVALALLAVEPVASAAGRPYLATAVVVAACAAVAVCGVDVVLGAGHQFLLGQAAFFGLGAYTFAIVREDGGAHPLVAAVVAVALAAVVGGLVGWVFFKLGPLLFAVGTLAVGVIGLNAMVRLTSLTGGSDGRLVQSLELFGRDLGRPVAGLAALGVLLGCVVAAGRWYVTSARGKRLRMVGVDPVVAASLGVDVRRVKVEAMVLSSALGALGGVALAGTSVILAPEEFSLEVSIVMVVAVVLGGRGTLAGPAVVLVGIQVLPELVESMTGWFDLLIGVLLVAGMAALRDSPTGAGGGVGARLGTLLSSRVGRRPGGRDGDGGGTGGGGPAGEGPLPAAAGAEAGRC